MTTTTGRGLAVTSPKIIYTGDGKRCYAYSGDIGVTNSEVVLLEATTTNHVIKGKIQFSYNANASDNYKYKIYFNGVVVFGYFVGHGSAEGSGYPDTPVYVIIPPNTDLKVTAENISSGSDLAQNAVLTGRVYE